MVEQNAQRNRIPKKPIEGCRITYRNFAGEKSQYNTTGARHFSILLDPDLAEQLSSEGFNVKYPQPRPDIDPAEDRRLPTLEVTVSKDNDYIHQSVKLYLVDGDHVTKIQNDDFKSVARLDQLRYSSVDVVLSPYEWVMFEGTPNERRGVKAYLTTAYFNLANDTDDDPFADKYRAPYPINPAPTNDEYPFL